MNKAVLQCVVIAIQASIEIIKLIDVWTIVSCFLLLPAPGELRNG